MNGTRIPLTVIGGFLGAGKTTLLNHLLAQSQGRRFAILVNDFGALNVDAALVKSQDANTIDLTNGCVCCQIGNDLAEALISVLEAPQPFDAIVLEASGVSDPWHVAQVGLADPGLALEAVIVLVDASAALEQAADPLLTDTLERQLRSADLIIVNKTDLIDVAILKNVHDWISGVAGPTPIFDTVQAQVPSPLLTGLPLANELDTASRLGHHASHDHGALFGTWVHRSVGPFQAQALRTFLREMPEGVLRLKGLIQTDEHGAAEIQFAGKHGSLRSARATAPQVSGVVAIGLKGRLPIAQLDAAFAAAAAAA